MGAGGSFVCLGIETSCDETAAAVVADGLDVRSNVVVSQVDLHRAFGGVVPEIACRSHVETILPVVARALEEAGATLAALDAVAVTHTPGLVGALLVGVSTAKALAWASGKPLVGVDHLAAHVYAAWLSHAEVPLPAVSLVVSGGHTSLYRTRGPIEHELLGRTRDDAAGEAFDKAATVLGLGYPGGPAIERAARGGDPSKAVFSRTYPKGDNLDFSFSGIKTGLLYHARGQNATLRDPIRPEVSVPDAAAGFQEAVVEMLVARTAAAARRARARAIVLGGGVACNTRLRERMAEEGTRIGCPVLAPPLRLCTDNAAMIAGLAFHLARAGRTSQLDLDAIPTA